MSTRCITCEYFSSESSIIGRIGYFLTALCISDFSKRLNLCDFVDDDEDVFELFFVTFNLTLFSAIPSASFMDITMQLENVIRENKIQTLRS